MKCPKCAQTINKTSKFCSKCGIELAESPKDNENTKYDLNELTDIFIGENKEKIKKGGFSIPALLLGSVYYYYRKMYFEATFILLLKILIALFAGPRIFAFNICLNLYMGFTFNRHYLKHTRETIDKLIMLFKENKDILLMQVYQKGSTTTAPIVILGTVYLLSAVGLFTYLFISSEGLIQEDYYSETPDYQYEDLYYTIPDGFTKNSKSTSYYELYEAETNSCSFSIYQNYQSTNNPSTPKKPSIEHLAASKNDEESTIINGYTWYLNEKDNKKTKTYELTYKGQNLEYNVSYFYLKEEDNTFCEDSFKELKDSLRIEP